MSWLCDAHGRKVGIVPGQEKALRDIIPEKSALRLDEPSGDHVQFVASNEDPTVGTIEGISLCGPKIGRRRVRMFPHYAGKRAGFIPGRRLVTNHKTGPTHWDHANRKFRKIPLPSGGFYLQTYSDDSLYVGIAEDGYLALTTEPFPWFLTSD